jgi:hypothetical protein
VDSILLFRIREILIIVIVIISMLISSSSTEGAILSLETVEELIIFIDLDNFGEISDKQGWVSYKPNEITGTLTHLVTNFVRKHLGEVIYGLDE